MIVQAEEDTLRSLAHAPRPRAPAITRRRPVTRPHAAGMRGLRSDGGIAHISGDLPVVADNAIVNKVTSAEKVWAGTGGLLGLLSTPGYTGEGIGVAVIDSGIADHSALASRRRAREPRVDRTRRDGRSVRPRHARRRHHRREHVARRLA